MSEKHCQFAQRYGLMDSLLTFGVITGYPKPILFSRDVFFELDYTLFKFPMHYLTGSIVFEQILIQRFLGKGELGDMGVGGDGTLETPFKCTKIDGKSLKSFLTLRKTAIYDQMPSFSKEEWVDILRVAYIWQMKKMGELAVRQLSNMNLGGIEKLKLAKEYGILDKEWRLSAIRELIKSTNLRFTEVNVGQIGIGIALKICKLHGIASQRSWLFPVTDVDIKKEFPELS